MSLREELRDWNDFDTAAFALGRALGLFPNQTFAEVKGTFWSNSHLGAFLHGMLLRLVEVGVLAYDDAEERFRWRGEFDEQDGLAEPDRMYLGPPATAKLQMSVDKDGFCLIADHLGFRYLSGIFSDIAEIPFEDGWHIHRDGNFRPSAGKPEFTFALASVKTSDRNSDDAG